MIRCIKQSNPDPKLFLTMKNFETRDEETADKELISSSNQSNWKSRCWHWGGLTSSDPIVKRRAQVICGICSIVWIVFILLLFLVSKFIFPPQLNSSNNDLGYHPRDYPKFSELQYFNRCYHRNLLINEYKFYHSYYCSVYWCRWTCCQVPTSYC